MNNTINKRALVWEPVVRDLAQTLLDAGFELAKVSDNEDTYNQPTIAKVVETICSVDYSALYVKGGFDDEPMWLELVLGNEPEELVSDYTARDTTAGLLLDQTVQAWSEKWEGVPQLTVGLVELLKTTKLV